MRAVIVTTAMDPELGALRVIESLSANFRTDGKES